jgi:UDP-N-acetylmuramoyl-tripeptide--D-alanyl-D-alanine ligase
VSGLRDWGRERIAVGAGAPVTGSGSSAAAGAGHGSPGPGPERVVVDSRQAGPGALFVGLRGENADGGEFAVEALANGAWGVLVGPEHAARAEESRAGGAVIAHPDPLAGLQSLAAAWLTELRTAGARVVAITGSTGKTSTKDILAALLSPVLRTVASPENYNTEIGLPLAVLAAPAATEVLVLELAMRGPGQIAELTAIVQPEVGVIVNIGPVHLELLGSLEAIAAAKAELIAGLAPGSTIVIPAEPLLQEHLRADLHSVTFGSGGDVSFAGSDGSFSRAGTPEPGGGASGLAGAPGGRVLILDRSRRDGRPVTITLEPSFGQAHQLENLLAAVAAAGALGVAPEGRVDVTFSAHRGQRLSARDGIVVIDDCYNANPMSMRAAIDELSLSAPARRVAVLGDMLELGPEAEDFHREVGRIAQARGVELLVTVGPLAAGMRKEFAGESHAAPDAGAASEMLQGLLRAGDTVLVKGSRGVGLELVVDALAGRPAGGGEAQAGDQALAPGAAGGRR